MLSRAVILFLFVSNAWSAGVTIEFPPVITIPSFPYTPTPEPVNENIETELKDLVPLPVQPIPVEIELDSVGNSEEGIEDIAHQYIRYANFVRGEFTVLSDDKLYSYIKSSGRLQAYTLDFKGGIERFNYPETTGAITNLTLRKRTSDFVEEGVQETHIWPYLMNTQGEFYYWGQSETEARYEGDWTDVNEAYPIPQGSDGYLEATHHPKLYELHGSDIAQRQDSTGVVFSYRNADEGGLWFSGNIFDGSVAEEFRGNVSPVSIQKSKLLDTHKGTAQFYIYNSGASTIKFISEVGFPEYSYTPLDDRVIENMDSIFSINGTLYFSFESEQITLIWHDKLTNEMSYVLPPQGVSTLHGCDVSQDRIFCVMKRVDDYILFELANSQFLEDRILDHELLEQGFVSINGIYAHDDNRFISIKTVDLRHRLFNFTPEGGFHNIASVISGDTVRSQFIASYHAGTFFWLVDSFGSVYAKKIVSTSLVEPEPEPEPATDGRTGNDAEGDDSEEEDKEIPFAEMEGSLNIYLLMLALLILMPIRLAKK